MKNSIFNEMVGLKPLQPHSFPEAEVQVSLLIPAKNSSETLESTVNEAHQFLKHRYQSSFEIVLIPNPSAGDTSDRSLEVANELARKYAEVRVIQHFSPRGKGAAIRTGFQASRGKWIFMTDSDLPYDLSFFDQAAEKLKLGYDLINGNRRLGESYFQIPVHLLRLVYGRHRLGLAFNRLVRWLLPISTTDTQAGIKAISRRLAVEAFSRQSSPGFLFDLEIFLTASAHGFWQIELPVTLHLNSEKSTVRILRECILVACWLTRISFRNRRKAYGPLTSSSKKILPRYKKASLSTRLFLRARWGLTPYSKMASRLPQHGTILDLGCGHGLLSLAIAMKSPARQILGIDHDEERISLAAQASEGLSNIQIEKGNMTQLPAKKAPYSGITMIDVMHYFDYSTQEHLFQKSFELLEPGGKLLVREVNPDGGLASRWNRLYEKIATGIGFTQSEKKDLYFRSRTGWEQTLENVGFKVHSEPCTSFLFADILYVCER